LNLCILTAHSLAEARYTGLHITGILQQLHFSLSVALMSMLCVRLVHIMCTFTVVQLALQGDRTPLHEAALKGRTGTVLALIREGVAVDVGVDALWTPLHLAIVWGRFDTVLALLQAGADPSAPSKVTRLALSLYLSSVSLYMPPVCPIPCCARPNCSVPL
jgi:hypothetical protein